MIRTIVLGSVAAAAFAGGFASAPAQAEDIPSYICDFVHPGFVAQGFENCEPSFNAVPEGRSFGPSFLVSRSHGFRLFCRDGGFAQTPAQVEGRVCTQA